MVFTLSLSRNLINTVQVDEFVVSLTDVHSDNDTFDGEEEVTHVNLTVFLLNKRIVKQNDSVSISVFAELTGQTAKVRTTTCSDYGH